MIHGGCDLHSDLRGSAFWDFAFIATPRPGSARHIRGGRGHTLLVTATLRHRTKVLGAREECTKGARAKNPAIVVIRSISMTNSERLMFPFFAYIQRQCSLENQGKPKPHPVEFHGGGGDAYGSPTGGRSATRTAIAV